MSTFYLDIIPQKSLDYYIIYFLYFSCERRMEQDCMDALGVDECSSLFKKLRRDYTQEYQLYNLSAVALSVCIPLVRLD